MAGKPWSEERRAAFAAKQAEKKAGAPSAPKRGPKRDPNAVAVETVWQTIGVGLMGFGRLSDAFLADSVVFQDTAAPMGDACAEIAKVNPRFEEFLSKGAPATPYLLAGTILFSITTQVAVNHGVKLGPLQSQTLPKSVLVQEAHRRMSEAQQQQAQMEAQAKEEQEWLARQAEQMQETVQAVREHDAATRQASEVLDAPELLQDAVI